MHPALLLMLASQRTAQTAIAAANGHHRAVRAGRPAWAVRERVGWALVHAGLRLVVVREPA